VTQCRNHLKHLESINNMKKNASARFISECSVYGMEGDESQSNDQQYPVHQLTQREIHDREVRGVLEN